MMRRFWLYLVDPRRLTIIGLVATVLLCFLAAQVLDLAPVWALLATLLVLTFAGVLWWWRRRRAQRHAALLAEAIAGASAGTGHAISRSQSDHEVQALRDGLLKALATIRGSKLGALSGQRALYELPWLVVIGNPAAGKSTAITNAGLQFPFADSTVLRGVAGTRNCDWFFTADGILLDTAGRYAVMDEHRAEWLGFLDLLKKYRRRAPVNGVMIAVSIAELRGAAPEAAIDLARSLRKRVQDLIERLEISAPVYVVFTKADLVAGFEDFFAQAGRAERERVWGATMPYQRGASGQQVLTFFEQSFDELCDGLKALSIANMGQQRHDRMAPGVFTFPLEFSTLRAPLRAFLAALFEDNPYQHKPVFRGFYFTSALQEGRPVEAQAQQVARRFALNTAPAASPDAEAADTQAGRAGFFLVRLFRDVIFADRDLVSQHASRTRIRLTYAAFFSAVVMLGAALGGWSWSYLANRQLVSNVQADLEQVVKLQAQRQDLQSRLAALGILQDRLEQLERYRSARPWSLRLGLYQGTALERKLRDEYFAGMHAVMVTPVTERLEMLLTEMNAHAGPQTATQTAPAGIGAGMNVDAVDGTAPAVAAAASPVSVDDGYNALKTYLMLADKSHAEAGHLNDQLTRHWRGWLEEQRGAMSREQMMTAAERLMVFFLAHVDDPAWPRINVRLALIDQSRDYLRGVVRGMPAQERVYAEIRARANTRFAAMTVARMAGEQDQALVAGSHAVPGAFTREAWEGYVQRAFREAATQALQGSDWVLKRATRDDLTLEGSPEQIEKRLTGLYKAEYVREWKKFIGGVNVANLTGFDDAVAAMNRLGDPQLSAIARILATIHLQTAWDGPAADLQLQQAQTGLIHWFKTTVLRQAPAAAPAALHAQLTPAADGARDGVLHEGPLGAISREFSGVASVLAVREQDKRNSLLKGYLTALSQVRARLNQLRNQGDPGPGARQLMQQTMEGTGSELADALRYVDEQMLVGMSDTQKQALRPILVRPLMQIFAVLIAPAEAEVNKTWLAQVYEPFQRQLAGKYPFQPDARVEAADAEIAQFFGPEGVIAKFATSAMGPLVLRRGDMITPRTWADMGITLAPQTAMRLASWIAPAGAAATGEAAAPAQTVFQIQPLPATGALEYTVEIDGQQLRYRNTTPQWASMVHPGPHGVAGARITAVAVDGRSVEVFNEPGPTGLKSLIDAAVKQRREGGGSGGGGGTGGGFDLRWSAGAVSVTIGLRIIGSAAEAADGGAAPSAGYRGLQLPETVVGAAAQQTAAATGSGKAGATAPVSGGAP